MNDPSELTRHWQLNSEIDFLNHGSFGATPRVVLQAQRELRDALELDPIRFLAIERELVPKLDEARHELANLLGADRQDVAFVRNATDGVNAVLRSMSLNAGDEIVVTDHGYNACNNAASFVADRAGGCVRVAKIPFPLQGDADVISAIEAELTSRTRCLVVDHVTSSTGLIFPITSIVALARQRGIPVLVDGAHAPGMIPVDLAQIGADFYTGNHHKWLCAPKASGFLHVRPEHQSWVRPTVISHGANTPLPDRSRFLAEFDWVGTYDPTSILSTPRAIEFLSKLWPGGLQEHQDRLRSMTHKARADVLNALGIPRPAPDHMIGSMASIPLPEATTPPADALESLKSRLYERHRIEVPVFRLSSTHTPIVRFSVQAYNNLAQYHRLADALRDEMS